MYHYRLVISYKGTHYFGWQDLGVNEQKPTIQASIQQVLKRICNYQDCIVSGASRTDAGVHAQGQVAKISIPISIEVEKLLLGMNSLLPNDIRIVQCGSCDPEFNSNKDSKSKEYHYYFCNDSIYNPIFNDSVVHIFDMNTRKDLNIALMQQACKLFIGKHDFYSFAKRDSNIASTIRTVFSCEIVKVEPSSFGSNTYYLKIVGDGFLKQMVRYIASSLFAVGKEQLNLSDISDALAKHKEQKISPKAKPHGLHLIKISY
ncbi:MAG: tRNA pseudouridine(38-40) synthase TruA [Gammaproteobacteria bacterium]|nr:MAG: tRNA pseudouridine(38-40) synthase TruA [Gammaproteobacteria bacterium]